MMTGPADGSARADRTMVEPDGISPGLAEQIQRLLDTCPEFAMGYRAASRIAALGEGYLDAALQGGYLLDNDPPAMGR